MQLMRDKIEFSNVTDDALLRLARTVGQLADEDPSTEFDDVRWIPDILGRDDQEHGVVTIRGAQRSVYVRLVIAEARLRGRKANREGLDPDVCPHSAVVGEIDKWTALKRTAWLNGYKSIEPGITINVQEPDDTLALSTLMALPIRSTESFDQKLLTLSKAYDGLSDAVLLALARVAIEAAKKPSRKQNGLRYVLSDRSPKSPAVRVHYRLNNRFIEGVDLEPLLDFID